MSDAESKGQTTSNSARPAISTRTREFVLLGAAVLLTFGVYLPVAAFLTKSRANEIAKAVVLLQRNSPTTLAPLVNDVPVAQFYATGMVGKRPDVRKPIFDIGVVEQDARALKQGLKSQLTTLKREASVQPASKTKPGGEDLSSLGDVMEILAPSLASKFLGYEQFFCYALTLWVVLLTLSRWRRLAGEEAKLDERLIQVRRGEVITPENADEIIDMIRERDPQFSSHLARVMRRAMTRFGTSRDVAAAEAVVKGDCESIIQRYDTSLAMVRYVIWAVPSIGFIGTVRGMGLALTQADSPDNLPAVVGWLGVAFDTTLVALFLSIGLMFLTHQFQRRYEQFVLSLGQNCEDELIHRLGVTDTAPAVSPDRKS